MSLHMIFPLEEFLAMSTLKWLVINMHRAMLPQLYIQQ